MSEIKNKNISIKKLNLDELSLFSYQLSIILKSGVPYLEGLELFKEESEDDLMKELGNSLYDDVKSGKKLYESFENLDAFPDYFIQMTKIAEKSGTLDIEMEELSNFYENREKTRYKIRKALVYPIILFILMASVIALLVVKVFPIFQEVLTSLGGDLPASTAAIFGLSKFLQNFGTFILIMLGSIIVILFIFSKTQSGNHSFDKFKINSSFLGKIYKKLTALRFAQGLSMMVKSGISFEDALSMSAPLTGNFYAEEKIKEAHTSIIKGKSVVDSLKEINIFPNLFIQMIRMGFKSGQIDSMLTKLCDIYKVELERSTERFTSSIEPALVIILSIVVGIILLTVMLPMIQIMSSIG